MSYVSDRFTPSFRSKLIHFCVAWVFYSAAFFALVGLLFGGSLFGVVTSASILLLAYGAASVLIPLLGTLVWLFVVSLLFSCCCPGCLSPVSMFRTVWGGIKRNFDHHAWVGCWLSRLFGGLLFLMTFGRFIDQDANYTRARSSGATRHMRSLFRDADTYDVHLKSPLRLSLPLLSQGGTYSHLTLRRRSSCFRS